MLIFGHEQTLLILGSWAAPFFFFFPFLPDSRPMIKIITLNHQSAVVVDKMTDYVADSAWKKIFFLFMWVFEFDAGRNAVRAASRALGTISWSSRVLTSKKKNHFIPQKSLCQFSIGEGVSSYMTDLSDKQASKQKKKEVPNSHKRTAHITFFFNGAKGDVWTLTPHPCLLTCLV